MSTIKINELATTDIALTDFIAKADANGLMTKNTVSNLSTFTETVGEVGFKGSVLIADDPTEDGWYLAGEAGTFTNIGGLVALAQSVTIFVISDSDTTYSKIDIPLTLPFDSVPTEGSTNAVQSGGVYDSVLEFSNKLNGNALQTNSRFDDNTVISGSDVGIFSVEAGTVSLSHLEGGINFDVTSNSQGIISNTTFLNSNEGDELLYSFYAKRILGANQLYFSAGESVGGGGSTLDITLTDDFVHYTGKLTVGPTRVDRLAFITLQTINYIVKDLKLGINIDDFGLEPIIEINSTNISTNTANINNNTSNLLTNSNDLIDLNGIENILSDNSRADENSVITSTDLGDDGIAWRNSTFAYNSTDKALTISPDTQVASGLRYSTILTNVPSNKNFNLSFEARYVSNAQDITTFIESSISSTEIIALTSSFVEYRYSNLSRGTEYTDGRLTIGVNSSSNNSDFEIRNIKIEVLGNINQFQSNQEVHDFTNLKISIDGDSISTNLGNNAFEKEVLSVDVGNSFTGYVTHYDVYTDSTTNTLTNLSIGGYTYLPSDIGNQITVTPLIGDVGKLIGKSLNFNTTDIENMWWKKLSNNLGAEILQNASWSGSSASSHNSNQSIYKTSYLWHPAQVNRLRKRDENGNNIDPDIILIFRGVNDFSKQDYSVLTDFGITSTSIPSDDTVNTNEFGYKEALALGIQKRREQYPNARIILCTLPIVKRINYTSFPVQNGDSTLPEFNKAIRDVAELMGCDVIDFDKSGITFENVSTYTSDDTHPNPLGQTKLAIKAIKTLRNKY